MGVGGRLSGVGEGVIVLVAVDGGKAVVGRAASVCAASVPGGTIGSIDGTHAARSRAIMSKTVRFMLASPMQVSDPLKFAPCVKDAIYTTDFITRGLKLPSRC
jgi:hypothetical protein